MAIGTYAELVTAVLDYVAEPSISRRIGDFIALAEAKINRRLREKEMVTKNASFSITGEYVAVPTSFGGVKHFFLNTSDRQVLEFKPDLLMTAGNPSGTARPKNYNVQGANFRFSPVPDDTYSATLIYYLQVPALTAVATTNWLLTSHPDVYLAGAQAEALSFLNRAADAAAKRAEMYALMEEIRRASNRDSYAGDAALFARPG